MHFSAWAWNHSALGPSAIFCEHHIGAFSVNKYHTICGRQKSEICNRFLGRRCGPLPLSAPRVNIDMPLATDLSHPSAPTRFMRSNTTATGYSSP